MTRITCIFRIREKIQATRLLYPMPKSSENLRKFLEELGNLREFLIYENFGKLRKRSELVLKFSENLRECSEIFGKFWKIFGNIRKCSVILGHFQKTLETVQKCFADVLIIFEIFGKSSEIFGSARKSSENFRT